MADTRRTLDAFLNVSTGLFKDSNNIPAQSLRDFSLSAYPLYRSVPSGRLTTESGVSASVSDRTAQSTLYYTPHNGNCIWIYDGTLWQPYNFSELSLALSGLTDAKNYDVFVYDNAGTLTLELSAAWTTDTARADALTTQDGVSVKSGSTTRLWLGTIRTTGTTTTEDSSKNRFVWNRYNQLARRMMFLETVTSWTYSSTTMRAVRGDTTSSTRSWVTAVCGMAGLGSVNLKSSYLCGVNATVFGLFSLGIDGVSADISNSVGLAFTGAASSRVNGVGGPSLIKDHGLGYHYYQSVEAISGTGTMDIYGTRVDSQSGIIGTFQC